MPAERAAFLDRDGTIIVENHFLGDPDAVQLEVGAVDALRLLREAGYKLVVVTNQSGIARGLFTIEDYHAVIKQTAAALRHIGSSKSFSG